MPTYFRSLGVFLLIFFSFSCIFSLHSVVGETNPVDSNLQAANNAVYGAFTDVLAAEKAGANVTSLLNQLNGAENLLAKAEMDYRTGDLSSASSNAVNVVLMSQQVISAAQAAEVTASTNSRNSFWFTVIFSSVGSVVFVLALFLIWLRIKKNYIQKISSAKPEVTQQ
jgi:hypothetical protein